MTSTSSSAQVLGTTGRIAGSVPTAQGRPAKPNTTGGLSRVRAIGRQGRAWLTEGSNVQFVDHNGMIIMEGKNAVQMPLVLFEAVSSKPELAVDGKITVLEVLDLSIVKYLIGAMKQLPSMPRVDALATTNDAFRDIQLCSAAEALGMGTFTQRIFNTYFKRVNAVVPTAPNIDAITGIRTPQGDKLFGQMAYNIAKKLWEKEFENGDAFQQNYLPTNPRLTHAINGWTTKFESKATRQAQWEKREAAREERQRKAAEKDRYYKEREAKIAAFNKEKEAVAAKKNEEAAAKTKAAGESYRDKKRRGVKIFTFEEARYAWKHDGVRVPVKAG